MSDELQELEPLEDTTKPVTSGATATADDADDQAAELVVDDTAGSSSPPLIGMPPVAHPGLAAPAYNIGADKEYFRFLFSGVVLVIGAIMPWGTDGSLMTKPAVAGDAIQWTELPTVLGFHTLAGAFTLWVGIGMVWSWWGAISTNKFRGANLKWVAFAIVPLMLQALALMDAYADGSALKVAADAGRASASIGDFFSDMFAIREVESQLRAAGFLREFGAGRLVVLIGALLAELFMVLAVFGGAKTVKQQNKDKAAARANRGGGAASPAGQSGTRRRR